ncbi:MAG: isochorismate synthase MenF [Acidimicrobiia bacterium]|nr:MAG: isochorismate synthase MenF [Acidimicrobiia bacterium]
MFLLGAEEIDALRADLVTQSGFRIASIDVAFDAFDFARTGESLVDRAVAYSMPNGDRLVGIGTAWSASGTGETRFADIGEKLRELGRSDLKAFIGFSFLSEGAASNVWDGYPPAEVFLPRIGIEQSGGGTRLTVIIPAGDQLAPTLDLLGSIRHPEWIQVMDLGDHAIESHPPVSDWAASVADAVGAIRRGDLDKVVLARSVVVRSTVPVAILRVFRELVRQYPQCYNFAWKSGDAVFMGASPELFADVDGNRFHSNPLAGSAPRGEGEDEDRIIAQKLMTISKEREEHALVVDDLTKRLAPLVAEMTVPRSPSLKQMATVQHLSTEIDGVLSAGIGILDIIQATHPTPAVGGVERDIAVRYIKDNEVIDRGWYSGGIGWINGAGDGAICIGLRCGLIRGNTTHVFAGAGIVADSEPEAELIETRLKLRPLMDLLTAN